MRKIEATGFEDYLPEERPTLYISGGRGNGEGQQVFLQYVDPEDGAEVRLGWFRTEDLWNAISNVKIEGVTE